MQTRQTFEAVEEHRLPTGERRFVHVLKAPVTNARSEVIGVQIVFWDVTPRVLAEEEIQLKNRDLETLLYVTSHDLREPLRAIQNFANLVSTRYSAQLDPRGQDFLARVVRGAERLDRLLEDVLTLSRVQRTAEPTSDVELAGVVRDVLQQLEGRTEQTHASVCVADDLPRVRADRRWVTQAVYNLVANALKFTRPGESPDIEIDTYVPHGNEPAGAGLVVKDRGPGVPAGYSERIFQLFQRAVGRDIEGTGAGLAIVRQIAERHGGKAWVRPREGGGAEFVVTFGLPPRNGAA
jgi:signal transduction histidine kinase